MKYLRAPVVVDAYRVTDILNRWATTGLGGLPEVLADAYENGVIDFPSPLLGRSRLDRLDIVTDHGLIIAHPGAWLVYDHGQLLPVPADTFQRLYSPYEPPQPKHPYTINESR